VTVDTQAYATLGSVAGIELTLCLELLVVLGSNDTLDKLLRLCACIAALALWHKLSIDAKQHRHRDGYMDV
tara:strand:+ start:446 stop:658 length:213 start_codon:yes stop_codon:yes gene_type:complete